MIDELGQKIMLDLVEKVCFYIIQKQKDEV